MAAINEKADSILYKLNYLLYEMIDIAWIRSHKYP